jgi:hypothetical protein
MIPTKIPELDKEQTEQLLKDLRTPSSKEKLDFWKNSITAAKNIKRRQ